MEDNDLEEARKRQTFYQSLVMEGKAMADIKAHRLQKILPFSVAFHKYNFSPLYASMSLRLRANDARTLRRADIVIVILFSLSFICTLLSFYALLIHGLENFYGKMLMALLSSLFSFMFGYGLLLRRYDEHARYKIYTDPTFFRDAMDIPGAVRIFWVLQQSEVPDVYTLSDFPRISGHIQNENAIFSLTDSAELRTLLQADSEVMQLFRHASIKGYIFSTVTLEESARAAYNPFTADLVTFERDITDLFTADMHFFDIMHKRYLHTFLISTGTGKQIRTITFVP